MEWRQWRSFYKGDGCLVRTCSAHFAKAEGKYSGFLAGGNTGNLGFKKKKIPEVSRLRGR